MTPEQREQVQAYMEECLSRRWERGVWDCALFAADVVAILTGTDHAAGMRGQYATREECLALLPVPLKDLPEHVGLRPSPPVDGAVFWLPTNDPEGTLGVVWQGRMWHPGRRGLIAPWRDISMVKFYT